MLMNKLMKLDIKEIQEWKGRAVWGMVEAL